MESVHDPFPMSELRWQLMWVVPRELPPVPLSDGRFIFGTWKMQTRWRDAFARISILEM